MCVCNRFVWSFCRLLPSLPEPPASIQVFQVEINGRYLICGAFFPCEAIQLRSKELHFRLYTFYPLATHCSDITNIEAVRLMGVNIVKAVKDAVKYSLIRGRTIY